MLPPYGPHPPPPTVVCRHGFSAVLGKVAPQLSPTAKKYVPAAMALATVPFIVHPIDHGTDWVLDLVVRPYLDTLAPDPFKKAH